MNIFSIVTDQITACQVELIDKKKQSIDKFHFSSFKNCFFLRFPMLYNYKYVDNSKLKQTNTSTFNFKEYGR